MPIRIAVTDARHRRGLFGNDGRDWQRPHAAATAARIASQLTYSAPAVASPAAQKKLEARANQRPHQRRNPRKDKGQRNAAKDPLLGFCPAWIPFDQAALQHRSTLSLSKMPGK